MEIGQPLTPHMLKLKVAEICEGKLTPFKDGIPEGIAGCIDLDKDTPALS